MTAAPGPSAALTALILSGLPPDRFMFAGFLPPRSAARRRTLAQWAALEATLIFFEGPSRLAASLADMAEILGDAGGRGGARTDQATRGNPPRSRSTRWPGIIANSGPPRGEAVIVIGPPEAAPVPAADEIDQRLRVLLGGHSLRDAVALLADQTGMARRTLYERALALTREEPEQGSMKTAARTRLRRQRARRRGDLAEFLCRVHLRLRLWRIVARDWRCPAGEIDIIARRGPVLAIIEVKARATAADAASAVSPRQRRRIARAASAFLLARPELAGLTVRFDVMLVEKLRAPRHLPGVWRADE